MSTETTTESTEPGIFEDMIDAFLYALGAKDVTTEAPIRAAHVRYFGLMTGVAGWIGGIYRAKSDPSVNVIGLSK